MEEREREEGERPSSYLIHIHIPTYNVTFLGYLRLNGKGIDLLGWDRSTRLG